MPSFEDFKLYPSQVYSAMNEVLVQNTTVFNEASRGALRLYPQALTAQFGYEAFQTLVADMVTRRDSTSNSAVSDLTLAQDEQISVKLDRRVGPVKFTRDQFHKIGGTDPVAAASFIIGEQAGKAILVDYVHTLISALVAAISEQTALVTDGTTGTVKTLTHSQLNNALRPFGDAAGRIVCWVMHSKTYFDLVGQAISDAIWNVADTAIFTGTTATLGRPVVVTDDSSLVDLTASPDEYRVLALTEGAADIIQSQPASLVTDLITGEQNLAHRVQGEHSYNLRIKGAKWKVASGGNPDATEVATSTNWVKIVTSLKDFAGTMLTVQ